ncbi:gamma-glutamyltransferase family protein [Lichenifustis flavocetrariae]|uniref:Gamma-glutamyltransferase n=1 Tax=Lichenifustis flavocetrariae TaxID=2949735 RepID=A0AA42CNJ6_9HYPH|nr:gamma-glutamyltransferase [Lichenifustis flavocetrariae]MCW6509467.1 gamma-glutamyltransferase [Lichenifustis flavocetrariae]
MTETPSFSHAAVAAPHTLTAQVGRDVLIEGGNAIEAMVAMAASIAVVYPHMNGLGGDGFWTIGEAGRGGGLGTVRTILAGGPAAQAATIKRYHDKDLDKIPARGPDAALTVPGTVDGWRTALDLSTSLGGTLPVDRLLGPAITQAREGVPVSRSEACGVPNERAALEAAPGFAEHFLVDGKTPAAGTLRRQPALAATLEQLTHAGLRDFYRGDISREMAADLERIGSSLTREDFSRFEARWQKPLSIRLADCTVYNTAPPTQGLASLLILGLFERLAVKRGETFEHLHGLIEASKIGLAIRDHVCMDPRFYAGDPADWLTPQAIEREAARIKTNRSMLLPVKFGHGDTIWMGAIDASGLAVSFIQSIYWEYGSGCVLPRTGILMKNRGVAFSLDERSPHALMPGRYPFHTLNPPLAAFDDGRVLSYGTMGGDGQPQFQAQVFSRYRLGMGLADAVDAPRFLWGRTWGADSTATHLEDRFDPSVVAALERAGHAVTIRPEPYAEAFGHAGAVLRLPGGRLEATHDPRSDGGPEGF